MNVHVLVEGPSELALFEVWSRRFAPDCEVRVYAHQGKGTLPADLDAPPDRARRGLLDQLPAKLRAFQTSLSPATDGVLIVLDADNDDPRTLETNITNLAARLAPRLRVHVRVAVEETEAFYLGDLRGLKGAYPTANMDLAREYVPDSVCGTWEYFGRVIDDGGGNKVAWAQAMSARLTTKAGRSRSPSFKLLCEAFTLLCARVAEAKRKRRPFQHRPAPKSGRRKGRAKA